MAEAVQLAVSHLLFDDYVFAQSGVYMLSFVFLLLMLIFAFICTRRILSSAAVFAEFKLNKILVGLVWLFPISPIVLVLRSLFGQVAAYVLALICFLSALITARKQDVVLQRAGTDRVKEARSAVQTVNSMAILGLLWVIISAGISWLEYGLFAY